jgi:signal peptidase I
MGTLLTLLRRSAGLLLLLELSVLVGLVAITQVAQHAGYPAYVIRGSSMAPAVPLGALIVDQPVDAARIVPGDVVSVRAVNGVVYTHRVVQVIATPEGLSFETRGDANATPDPAVAPATAIVGRVLFHVPLAGFIVAMLAIPAGMLSLLSIIGSTLLLFWLLEDPEVDEERQRGALGLGGPVAAPATE